MINRKESRKFKKSNEMTKREFKTINQLVEENDSFISIIPNVMGINLCSVEGIEYHRNENNYLLDMTILFQPNRINPDRPDINRGDYFPITNHSIKMIDLIKNEDPFALYLKNELKMVLETISHINYVKQQDKQLISLTLVFYQIDEGVSK